MFLSEYPSPSRFCKHSLGTFLSLLLLSACSPDNDALPGDDGGNTPSAALRIEVSASDFSPMEGTNTRATDNGATTTFENGDCIGIIVLDNSGNLLSDNIPYIYNDNTWSFDSNNGEGKTAVYYDNKATNYIAYFPYSSEADGIAGADVITTLQKKFPPQYDQRTKDAYRASDLLVWSSETGSTPLKKLEIKFTHAYSSLSLSPSVKCEINGAKTSYIPSSVEDVSFTIGTEPLLPYRADDGSYRIIVSPQTAAARWFCSYKAKMYGGTMTETSLTKNTRYTLAPTLDIGDYIFANAQVGDFYCKNDKDEGYLIPAEAPLTAEQKTACLGVVLKVGKDDGSDWADDCNYKLKDDRTDMTIHGYVLALNDANDGNDCQWGSSTRVYADRNQDTGFYGYKNTQAIKDIVVADKKWADAFPATYYATVAYEDNYTSPANSSGWFLPSAGQCWYWFKNEGVLLSSIKKASGNENYNWKGSYWSSSESYGDYPAEIANFLNFDGNRVDRNYKYVSHFVRSCLAF